MIRFRDMPCKFAVLPLALAALPVSGWAWGCSGHHIVALIAREHLNARARAAVYDLLSALPIDPDLARYCKDGMADAFVSAATWADDVKRTEGTGGWHYIDIPLAVSSGDPNRYCEPAEALNNGSKPGCLLSALRDLSAALGKGERADRARALRYVIHLIGDLHMPLHVSDNGDRGGNCVPLHFGSAAAPTNLHSLWDSGILDSALSERHLTEQQFAVELDRRYREEFGERAGGEPQMNRWAWEVHKFAVEVSYGKLVPPVPVEPPQSVSDCAAESTKIRALNIVIGKEYRASAMDAIEQLLAMAGYRLAALLNQVWP